MKGLLKALFTIFFVLAVIATAGLAFLYVRFKADFEDIERHTKEIVAEIEAANQK